MREGSLGRFGKACSELPDHDGPVARPRRARRPVRALRRRRRSLFHPHRPAPSRLEARVIVERRLEGTRLVADYELPRYASASSRSSDDVAMRVGGGARRGCGSASTLAGACGSKPPARAPRSASRPCGEIPNVTAAPSRACSGVMGPTTRATARSGARSRTITAGGWGSSSGCAAVAAASAPRGSAARSCAIASSAGVGTRGILGRHGSTVHARLDPLPMGLTLRARAMSAAVAHFGWRWP